jgi:hypothetical protein
MPPNSKRGGHGLEVRPHVYFYFFIKKINNMSFIFIFFNKKKEQLIFVEADNVLFYCLIFDNPMNRKPGKNSPIVFWNKQLLFNQFLS